LGIGQQAHLCEPQPGWHLPLLPPSPRDPSVPPEAAPSEAPLDEALPEDPPLEDCPPDAAPEEAPPLEFPAAPLDAAPAEPSSPMPPPVAGAAPEEVDDEGEEHPAQMSMPGPAHRIAVRTPKRARYTRCSIAEPEGMPVMNAIDPSIHAEEARLVLEYDTPGTGAALCGATLAGRRLVLASNAYLLRLVPDSGRVIDRLETFPAEGGLAYDGYRIWQYASRRFEQLDGRTGLVVQSVSTDLRDLTGLECLEGGLLALHDEGRRLAWLHFEAHGRAKKAVAERDVMTAAALHGLCWVGGELWSASGSDLLRLDPVSAAVLERLSLPGSSGVRDMAGDVRGRFWCVDGVTSGVRVFERPEGTRRALEHFRSASETAVNDKPMTDTGAMGLSTAAAEDQFERILVPVDFSAASRCALAVAFLLHERVGSEIHLFNLAEQGENSAFLAGAGANLVYGDFAGDARAQLHRFVDHLFPGRSSEVFVHVRIGTALARRIDEVSMEVGATLVLLAGTPQRTLFRSRIERIARDVHCAVMVLPVRDEVPTAA
jgi:nucleotide-binding universal stress UspA family protein